MVELRLEPLEALGPLEDCFVSVRVGEMQKLSRISSSRVYRFPKAGTRNFGKIEVYRRIGSCSVDVNPSTKDFREVSIDCGDAASGPLNLKVEVSGKVDADPVEPQKEGTKVRAAKEYLSQHGLEMRLSEAMQAVLRERPEDPAKFLAGKLTESRDNVGGLKLSRLKMG
eukprot:CAMPEP_0185902448 /NCGR_PEP_ID=MMETSP0196C-20130402/1691_1 /TAXON_ID=2932 /ORGANISM="Alexandrium fundyense, Strain CCMP1719" /LENGTH=168 /DNA_ID=CAMNT_0028621299 /DNA_START=76 /DNA_END=582 /DNA_ORIENTATION=+